ncbi:MAG: endonuclease/exonuclease/phosphatase family protein [Oligoflexia bacterium]|nr:endonuclease/exonuclease/phosphatase family protein [Oligoflexia bacterium]
MQTAQLLSTLLSVLSFNIWAVPDAGFHVVSPLRAERVEAICSALREAPDDVVLLQEVWSLEDRNRLLSCGYDHFAEREDPLRPLDSGLLILSKYPLDSITRAILYFPSQPPQDAIANGESLPRKSVLVARVRHPQLGPIWVANTHLISFYDTERDTLLDIRRRQFLQVAEWARQLAGDEPLIVGGDWNFGPGSPIWNEVPAALPGFTEAPEAATACTLCPPNALQSRDLGKIDHLFGSSALEAIAGEVAMKTPVTLKGIELNLSDHFAWRTRFRFKP